MERPAGEAELDGIVRAAAPYATAVTLAVAAGDRQAVHCHGRLGRDTAAPCTPETVFELGSVTKTFTALLLSTMAARGELTLDDPVERHLPRHWRPAAVRSGAPIRLLHLATHTSGLPRLPPGLLAGALPAFFSNPYAAFGDEQLRSGLTRTTVHHRPGSYFAYSNYGVGLLGRLLAETGAGTYAELLADRVCRPLGLRSATTGRDTPGRATGHRRGRPLPPWHIPGLPGAGAVRAGGADLLRYLRAHLSPGGGELGTALRDVQRPRLRLPRSADQLALVWNHRRIDGRDLYFHSGATRGFTAFVGFCPRSATAVAALANCGPALDGRFVQGGYEVLKRLSHDRG
ncbi:serine hydrolase domain-containing protein [Kitasatospora sp. RG8]|uniref:serine hydrolase domain-containing protein n=1 Tax=Kitasatospora sp. RG8 TaxID=2820815 RepID=UPI0027DD3966|nr:serine hydrolase domain-containing protein [Kitasatospora sp. RG8]